MEKGSLGLGVARRDLMETTSLALVWKFKQAVFYRALNNFEDMEQKLTGAVLRQSAVRYLN